MKIYISTIICIFLVCDILFGQNKKDVEKDSGEELKVAAYLYFNYNAKEAIETYKSVFDAVVIREHLFSKEMTQNQYLIGKIFHAELKIGDLNLYISDSDEQTSCSSFKFVVEIGDDSKARKCFEKLAENGKIISNFKKMSYGPTIAQVEDKFGIKWEIVIC